MIDVYQGDEIFVKDNKKIREFLLDEIPPDLQGEQSIEVAFSYDLNEILKVTAKILSTGKTITEIINLLDNSKDPGIYINLGSWRDYPLAERVGKLIEFSEKKLKSLSNSEKGNVAVILNHLKEAVINNNEELVDKYDEELTNIMFDLN